jgi:competence protein ComEC
VIRGEAPGVLLTAIGWFAGCVAPLLLPELPAPRLLLATTCLLAATGIALRQWPVLACAVGLLLGWQELDARLADRLEPGLEGVNITVRGRVASVPMPAGEGLRFRFEPQHPAGLPGCLELTWYDAPWVPLPAERLELELRLRRPRGFANPGGTDYAARMLRLGVGAAGYVRDGRRLGRRAADLWRQPLVAARGGIASSIRDVLGERPATGIVLGLAVGLQEAISREQWRVLSDTGTSHLMAISGMHVGMVGALAALVAATIQRRRQRSGAQTATRDVAVIAGACTAFAYALLAGWSVPTQRTAIMIASAALALGSRRCTSGADILALAAIVVLVIDPLAPMSVGFWLSFGAVGLLLTATGGFLVDQGILRGYLRAQLAVSFGLIPVLLAAFGQFSLVSVGANLLAIPLYTLGIVPMILVGTVTLALVPPAGTALLEAAAWLVEASWIALEWAAAVPLATWSVAALPPLAWIALVAAALGMLLPLGWTGRAAAAALLIAACTWRPEPLAAGTYRLTLLDVGQGLSAVVQTRQHVLVYDAGPAFRSGVDAGALAVLPYLRSRGIRRVDVLALSHDDADHTGGGRTLLSQIKVDSLVSSGPVSGLDAAPRDCTGGSGWIWDDVSFEWLDRRIEADSSDNDRSCVLRVSSGGRTLLLTGDIGRAAEAALLERGSLNRVDIVVAAHHGSRSSSSAQFVAVTSPRWVLFSAGHRNRWGFPAPEVVARWRNAGAEAMETAAHGAIEFVVPPAGPLPEPDSWRQRHRRPWRDP